LKAAMPLQAQRLYEFGPFQLDPDERRLLEHGRHVPLTPKAFQTLLVLVENPGRVVEKDDLLKKVWPDTFVEEATLAQNIFTLRKQLRDDRAEAVYIETVPKRGYRFAAPVRFVERSAEEPPVPRSQPLPAPGDAPRTLRFLWIVAALAVTLAVTIGFYPSAHRKPQAPRRAMLLALPVQNLTGDATQEYLADGLTEEVIADLGSLNPERLGVIARTSAMAYKQRNKTVQEIAHELGVDYVLETSLREGSGHVRFTAQLIRTQDQTHVWAHNYDRPLTDVLALQGELARAVAEEIRVGLAPEVAARLSSPRAVEPAAYDAFIRGRYHWNERSAAEVRSAIKYFQQAIAKDPTFAPAYASLADSYVLLTMMRDAPPSETMPKAKEAVLKALSLDDSLSDAHTVLGEISEVLGWDWADAEKEFRKGIELDPNNSNAYHQYAIHLAVSGRFPEALARMRHAQQLDPVSPVAFSSTGWIYLRSRLPDQAIAECQKALDMDAKYARGHLCLGEAYEEKGDLNKAAEEFLAARNLTGMTPEELEKLRKAIQGSGYEGYFRVRLEQLQEKAMKSYVSPYDFADFTLRTGDREGAFKWLEAAYQEHSPYLVFLHIEPRMDPIRSDPRFQDLLRRTGLDQIRITPIQTTP
jgi:TolB-like protein/DNA-binding winged helix-turn-helix (wHTH) protein